MNSRDKLIAAVAGIAVAGLAAACGGTSAPGPSPSPATSPATATSESGFRSVATGPLAQTVKADALSLSRNAGNPAAAEAAARKLVADLGAWTGALQAAPVAPQHQAVKNKMLQGLDQMRKGVTEYADGLRTHDSTLITRGQADVQAGASIISQAAAQAA